jgi:RNA polymerase sigma-70 factor, ECF subfamily
VSHSKPIRKLSLVTSEGRADAVLPAPSQLSDADSVLVVNALAGDTASKERLYRKHVDYIAGMSARLLRSIDASEDVVQDTFVIALQQLTTLREPAAFRPWLASIAVSQVRRRMSRQRLLRFLGLDRGLDDASLDELARADTSAEARLDLAALDVVLSALPPDQRIAWMLQHVEGETLENVALACRCSLATVKRRISAAEQRVRAYVEVVTKQITEVQRGSQ